MSRDNHNNKKIIVEDCWMHSCRSRQFQVRRIGVVEFWNRWETSPSSAYLETSSLYFRDFHFRGCTLTGGSSWKTITYRWLWIFRGSGSALFRSRECYGAEFSTVLFPLRHVPPPLRRGKRDRQSGKEANEYCEHCRQGEVSTTTFPLVSRGTSETQRRERKYKNQTERETLTFWHFQVWWDFSLSFRSLGMKFFLTL